MNRAVLEFLPEALADAAEATRYYEECQEGLGVRFRAEIESLCVAIHAYAGDNGGCLPGFGKNSDSRWLHQVAPFLGYASNETVDGIPVAKGAYAFEVFSSPSRDTWMAPKVCGNAGIYGINPNLI